MRAVADEPADEQPLHGGVANQGRVVRCGPARAAPSNPHSASIHAFLRRVRAAGFDGVPAPVGIDADGRERLEFIEGDVALPPYPGWARSDEALASVATMMARYHRAAVYDGPPASWNCEIADPSGGPVVCHNDVCLENVVFCDGVAVGLLDFDFCAPGRPVYDLAQFVRMCVPIDDDESAGCSGGSLGTDRPGPGWPVTATASGPRAGPSCSASSTTRSTTAASS